MKKIVIIVMLTFLSVLQALSQVPEQFNYQGVLRNSAGELVENTAITVKISVLQGSSSGPAQYSESHSVSTNAYGQFTVQIGTGTDASGTFSTIDWSNLMFLKTEVANPAGGLLVEMGIVQLISVPYALYSKKAKELDNNIFYFTDSDTLFAVKDREGNVVFVVFPDGAKVITNLDVKGKVGGFAVSGRTSTKQQEEDYFQISPDSARFYINEIPEKGKVGGFAVSGRTSTKGELYDYIQVTKDSTKVYITESAIKGKVGGFAVSGRTSTKLSESKDYFNISGNLSAEIINPSEPRILWYPKKEAFLTGRVLIESPDSVGTNSVATGFESKAIGNYSQAMGYKAIARGNYSMAIGNNSIANSDNSFAFGDGVMANFPSSIALGRGAKVEAEGGFSFGYNSISSGVDAYAFGTGTEASGEGSFAIGFIGRDSAGVATGNTLASGKWSLALGMGSQATEQGSVAIGTQCISSGSYATSIGLKNSASGWNAFSMGQGSQANGESSIAFGGDVVSDSLLSISIGSCNYSANFASLAMGHGSISTGYISTAIGWGCSSTGQSSFSAGNFSQANGSTSVSIGIGCISTEQASIAMGWDAISKSNSGISIGNSTYVESQNNLGGVAIGWAAKSYGDYSVSIGNGSEAFGSSSIAIGSYTKALGIASFAANTGTISIGVISSAFGNGTVSEGDCSFTMGQFTKAKSYASLVIGQYNDTTCSVIGKTSWSGTDPVFIIGNGTSTSSRTNAITILQNGNTAIGHGAPTQMLDVNGNARFRTISSGTYSTALAITTDGTLTTSTSDISMKKNIVSISHALQKILEMNGVYFSWKNDNLNSRRIGFIAQEMEEVLPEVVFTNPIDGLKGINYNEISAVLVEAVKELKAENDELKEQLVEMNKRLEKLEK